MTAAIDILDLHFSYPDGRNALRGIDLRIEQGESVGIIGPNGAGKTTLLLHLNGILQGTGEIAVFGLRIDKSSLKSIRKDVGVVFQDPDDQLFSSTVFDDVAFGPLNTGLSAEQASARTREALAEVGMAGFESSVPHHLSFGEKKRVSIATVLSMRPKILALDEPSSNLDPRQRRNLIQLLGSLRATKLIASHDLPLIFQLCDRTVLLNSGVIVADGTTTDIMHDRALLEANDLEAVPTEFTNTRAPQS